MPYLHTELFDTDCYTKSSNYEESLTLLFVLSGSLQFATEKYILHMQREDVFAIRPYLPFHITVSDSDTHYVVLRFPHDQLQYAMQVFSNNEIICSSCGRPQKPFLLLKQQMAEIFWLTANSETGSALLIRAEIYHLLFHLFREYGIQRTTASPLSQSGVSQRIRKIIQYIGEHYTEKITLESTAQYLNITPNYLSHFFRKSMDTTFSHYLTQVRLHAAMLQLLHTSDSITDIAMRTGFSSMNAFYLTFRREFQQTPLQYRTANRTHQVQTLYHLPMFHTLTQYRIADTLPAHTTQANDTAETIVLTLTETDIIQPHNWQKIINIGYASEGLNANVQEQLRILQREIGFRHLRFHGVLDDTMHIYDEKEDGTPIFYFAFLDMLLDFLDSIGLMPYMEFSFIPSALAQHHYRPFVHPAFISRVTDLSKWSCLIRSIVEHCTERYGAEKVKQWYFSFLGFNWVQAFIPDEVLNIDDYYTLYFATYRAVKSVNPAYRFGGPATDAFLLNLPNKYSISQWFDLSKRQKCSPDFIALHTYPDILERYNAANTNSAMSRDERSFRSSGDPDYVSHAVADMRNLMQHSGHETTPLLIDEWDATLWQREPLNDTCYHSAYIAKTIMENSPQVAYMAQANVSDYSEEAQPGQNIFFGGSGLFTSNGLRKSGFYVYQLLSRLGEQRLAAGKGWTVFRKGKTLQLVLYYYCAYNREQGYRINAINQSEPYSVFREKTAVTSTFTIPALKEQWYTLRKWRVGRTGGSVYDKWVEIGRPAMLTAEEREYLDAVSRPLYTTEQILWTSDSVLSCTLAPHDVVLIELEPDDK